MKSANSSAWYLEVLQHPYAISRPTLFHYAYIFFQGRPKTLFHIFLIYLAPELKTRIVHTILQAFVEETNTLEKTASLFSVFFRKSLTQTDKLFQAKHYSPVVEKLCDNPSCLL